MRGKSMRGKSMREERIREERIILEMRMMNKWTGEARKPVRNGSQRVKGRTELRMSMR